MTTADTALPLITSLEKHMHDMNHYTSFTSLHNQARGRFSLLVPPPTAGERSLHARRQAQKLTPLPTGFTTRQDKSGRGGSQTCALYSSNCLSPCCMRCSYFVSSPVADRCCCGICIHQPDGLKNCNAFHTPDASPDAELPSASKNPHGSWSSAGFVQKIRPAV